MFGLGTTEIIVIVVIALLLFGSRLPNVAKNAGKSIRGFKDEVTKAVTGEGSDEEEKKDAKKPAGKPVAVKKAVTPAKKK